MCVYRHHSHVYWNVCISTCMYIDMYVYRHPSHVYWHVCISTWFACINDMYVYRHQLHVYWNICISTCMYIEIYVYRHVCILTCMYIDILCMYVDIHVSPYTFTCMYINMHVARARRWSRKLRRMWLVHLNEGTVHWRREERRMKPLVFRRRCSNRIMYIM